MNGRKSEGIWSPGGMYCGWMGRLFDSYQHCGVQIFCGKKRLTAVRPFADAVRLKANSSYADFRLTQILKVKRWKS